MSLERLVADKNLFLAPSVCERIYEHYATLNSLDPHSGYGDPGRFPVAGNHLEWQ